ncbi:Uncharacterised protein [uncultured archaeon]|nr:Uncharacterised protein [uncultured archaeon]
MKKDLFPYLIALFVISGCVDEPQIQTESDLNQVDNGWNQAKYETYSRLYNELQYNGRLVDGFTGGLPNGRTTFEWAWGNAFVSYEKGLELEVKAKTELDDCSDPSSPTNPYERIRDQATNNLPDPIRTPTKSYTAQKLNCLSQYQSKMRQVQSYFTESRNYRQKIEEMKPK